MSVERSQQIAREVFDGVMIGDGGLVSRGKSTYFDMALSSRGKKVSTPGLLEYLRCVKEDCFDALGIKERVGCPKVLKRARTSGPHAGEIYEYASLASRSSPFLASQHCRWYPDGSHYKEVPGNLVLTPVSLAHWFMGDGSSGETCSYSVQCELSTPGFNLRSIEILEACLHNLGVGTYRAHRKNIRRGSGIRILVLQPSVDYFMDLVSPHVIEPYRYKIKYRHGPSC